MGMIGRFILAVVLTASGLSSAGLANDKTADSKEKPAAPAGLIPFELGKPIPVSVTVKTDMTSFKLFHLREIEFQLDKKSHLTAIIGTNNTTGLTDLPTVDYHIYAAVFDANGKLLGTANTSQKIHTWSTVGYVSIGISSLNLDFGTSLNYDKAKYFALAINEPDIKKRNPKQPDKTE